MDLAVFIFTVDMLHFFSFDEKSRVHMHYAAMRQSVKNRILRVVSQSLRFLQQIFYIKCLGPSRNGGGGGGGGVKEHFPYLINCDSCFNFHLFSGIQIEKITQKLAMFTRIGLHWRGVAWKHLFRISSVLNLLKYLLVSDKRKLYCK